MVERRENKQGAVVDSLLLVKDDSAVCPGMFATKFTVHVGESQHGAEDASGAAPLSITRPLAMFWNMSACAKFVALLCSASSDGGAVPVWITAEGPMTTQTYDARGKEWELERHAARAQRLRGFAKHKRALASLEKSAASAASRRRSLLDQAQRAADEHAAIQLEIEEARCAMERQGADVCAICHRHMLPVSAPTEEDMVQELRVGAHTGGSLTCMAPSELREELTMKMRGCGHRFHQACVHKWLTSGGGTRHTTCPICRREQVQRFGKFLECPRFHRGLFLKTVGAAWLYMPVGSSAARLDPSGSVSLAYAFPVAMVYPASNDAVRCIACVPDISDAGSATDSSTSYDDDDNEEEAP